MHGKRYLSLPKSKEISYHLINNKIHLIKLKNNGFYPYIFIVVVVGDVKGRIHKKIITASGYRWGGCS